MQKSILKVALATAVALLVPSASKAQLGDLLKSAASSAVSSSSSNGTVSTVSNIITSLLGTSTVSQSSLVGTWTYQEPCIVAESQDVISKVAASAAVSKVQNQLSSTLQKAGVKAGNMKITFESDGSAKVKIGSRTVAATYKVNGSDLTLTFTKVKKTIKMNCKLASGKLQLSMKADKLLTLINTVSATAASASTSLATINSLLKSVDGLYIGLQFTK